MGRRIAYERKIRPITQRRGVTGRERKRIQVHTLGVVLWDGVEDSGDEEDSSSDYSEEESYWEGEEEDSGTYPGGGVGGTRIVGERRRAWMITLRRRVTGRERKRIQVHTMGVVWGERG